LYTAPASISASQSITVTATSTADPTKSGSVVVNLVPPITITVTPNAPVVGLARKLQFTASVSNSSDGVTWSISPNIGTISATGLYAGPTGITGNRVQVSVTATSVQDPTVKASALVTIVKNRLNPLSSTNTTPVEALGQPDPAVQ
jgi:hypothetical protein